MTRTPQFSWSPFLALAALAFAVAACGGADPSASSTNSTPVPTDPVGTDRAGSDTTAPVPLAADGRVLLIGDSIAIGYTPAVQTILGNPEPMVVHPGDNARWTGYALSSGNLESWLGSGEWDVIHFNFGLHDLAWADASGAEVPVGTDGAGPRVPLQEYRANLHRIIDVLEPAGARLVWATTTPVYTTAWAREAGAEIAYNEVALEVMEERGVAVDDLWSLARDFPADLRVGGDDNIHFNEAGYAQLAAQVAQAIQPAATP